ncbi:hypothetical protein HK414_02865 [Ramlibacter terrae]|uniref:Uncharacterized protein n=1 Tax=Ramlibacter terrae TaxID=2732511 RepID=A0ABX6P074_9BURK|nr:hypothetical protein HK414_02865 [Ramlibacter terrae]
MGSIGDRGDDPARAFEAVVGRTSVTTAVSSVVLAVSVAMSVTGVTLRLIVRVAVLPASSVTVTVKLSAPW